MNTLLRNNIFFRGSYVILAILLLIIRSRFRRKKVVAMLFWVIIAGLFIRGRFIETNQITIEEYNISIGADTTVALIADLHLGVYKDWTYLQEVVNTLNAREDVDVVLVAGDLTYNPSKDQTLQELFSPLQNLQKPLYIVLGNHDVGVPGDPTIRYPLITTLEEYGAIVLQNDIVWINNFFLVGLGPYLSGESATRLLDEVTEEENVVVLAHNPDVISQFPNNHADLTLVGHTHCGQIRPPFIYEAIRKHIVPVEGDFDCGLSQQPNTTLFITPGLGEVMIPARFNNPPTISILNI